MQRIKVKDEHDYLMCDCNGGVTSTILWANGRGYSTRYFCDECHCYTDIERYGEFKHGDAFVGRGIIENHPKSKVQKCECYICSCIALKDKSYEKEIRLMKFDKTFFTKKVFLCPVCAEMLGTSVLESE